MRRIVLGGSSLVLVAGCFLYGAEDDEALPPRVEATPDANAPDTTNGSSIPDASDDSVIADANTICDPRKPFTTVAPISEVNTPDDETHAHLSTDELTMYLSRQNFVAVYTRDKRSEPWKGGVGLDINGGNSSNVRVTDDTLRAYFDAYLGGGLNATRLITKSRPTTTSAWGDSINRTFELGAADGITEIDPFPSPNEDTMFFASNRSGVFTLALSRKIAEKWQPPLELKGANTNTGDRKPVAAMDGSYVYFQSARPPGNVGEGKIWLSFHVPNSSEPNVFGDAVLVSGLETTGAPGSNSWPTWVSPDNCRLYFISSRAGGKGKLDLWLASRSP